MREAALIEVIAEVIGQLLSGEALRLIEAIDRNLLAVVPPCGDGREVFGLHRLGLGEVLIAFRHIEAIEPRLLRGLGAVEEQDIRGDGRIRREDAAGQADDGMEIELREELLFDVHLGVVGAEKEAVGQDDRSAAVQL